jgi:hypothetical protein
METDFAVAQISNLPYRQVALGWVVNGTCARFKATRRRLQICDTAEFNSALQTEQSCPAPIGHSLFDIRHFRSFP